MGREWKIRRGGCGGNGCLSVKKKGKECKMEKKTELERNKEGIKESKSAEEKLRLREREKNN